MVVHFLFAKLNFLKFKKNLNSFEDDLTDRVGKALYKNIFEPIARKLWGNPKTLDLKLSQGRVQIPSFLEIILNVLNIRRKSNFEALNFGILKVAFSLYGMQFWLRQENSANL